MLPERKLYQKLKKNIPSISWNRIENLSLLGMPDLLGYNKNNQFFTVELKVVKGNKIRFSPHQIAWHKRHPKNTFIMVETLDPRTLKTFSLSLFHGSSIMSLVRYGMKVAPVACDFVACALVFENLKSP
jgi:Holliday junction resolvase